MNYLFHKFKGQITIEFMIVFIVLLMVIMSFFHFYSELKRSNENEEEFKTMYNIIEPLNDAILDAKLKNKITILSLPEHNCEIKLSKSNVLSCDTNNNQYSLFLPCDVLLDDINPGDMVLIYSENNYVVVKKGVDND